MIKKISSANNKEIKLFRRLQASRCYRSSCSLGVLEGERLLAEAISAGISLRSVFYTHEFLQRAPRILQTIPKQTRHYLLQASLFSRISDTPSPQGIAAIFHLSLPASQPMRKHPCYCVLLDGVQDPGNMGSIARTATAAGVDVLFLGPGCVDPYNPKALRASMGSFFRLPPVILKDLKAQVEEWQKAGYLLLAADPHGETVYFNADFNGRVVLMIGSEAKGLEPWLLEVAHQRLKIPLLNQIESLNAAAAAAILIYEGVRHHLQ